MHNGCMKDREKNIDREIHRHMTNDRYTRTMTNDR